MSEDAPTPDVETIEEDREAAPEPPPEDEPEFELTVRKLERPVRPRGVLAE